MTLEKKSKASERVNTSLFILQSLRRINRVVDMCSKEIKRDGNLTLPQILSLLAVSADGPLTVAQIASYVFVSSSTMIGIIDRLEVKKLLKRERSASDRREVYVNITEEGKRLAEKAPIPLQEKLTKELTKLTDSQEKVLIKSVEKLVKMLDSASKKLSEEVC